MTEEPDQEWLKEDAGTDRRRRAEMSLEQLEMIKAVRKNIKKKKKH